MIENFSAGYYIIDAEVVSYSGEQVAAPHDLLKKAEHVAPLPLFKLDGQHYMAEGQHGIPANTLAVPDYVDEDEATPVLLAKEDAAVREVLDTDETND